MAVRKIILNFIFVGVVFFSEKCNSFVINGGTSYTYGKLQLSDGPYHGPQVSCYSTTLRSDKFNRDINEKSIERASSKGGGSVAAGAILGGLVGGPFGALFGAAVGGNIGTKNAFNRARKEEMEKKGITQDMLDAAEEVGYALEQSMIGIEATKESLRSQQSLARRIEEDANDYYEKAKTAMADGREEDARSFLLKRSIEQDRLKDVLKQCAEEVKRNAIMESNVGALQKRAMEVEAMLQRAVGAKARQDSSDLVARQSNIPDTDLSLSQEDPLLKKI